MRHDVSTIPMFPELRQPGPGVNCKVGAEVIILGMSRSEMTGVGAIYASNAVESTAVAMLAGI